MTERQEKPPLFSMEHAFHGRQSQHPVGVNSSILQVGNWNLGRADDHFLCVSVQRRTILHLPLGVGGRHGTCFANET